MQLYYTKILQNKAPITLSYGEIQSYFQQVYERCHISDRMNFAYGLLNGQAFFSEGFNILLIGIDDSGK